MTDEDTIHTQHPTKKRKGKGKGKGKEKGEEKGKGKEKEEIGESSTNVKGGDKADDDDVDDDEELEEEPDGKSAKQKKHNQRLQWLQLANDPILVGFCVELLRDHPVSKILMGYFRRTFKKKKEKKIGGSNKFSTGLTLMESIWLGILANRLELDFIFRQIWSSLSEREMITYQFPPEGPIRNVASIPNPYKTKLPPCLDDRTMRAIFDTILVMLCNADGIPEEDVSASEGTERKLKKFLVHWLAWSINLLGDQVGHQWSLHGAPTDSPHINDATFQSLVKKFLTMRGKVRTTKSASTWTVDYSVDLINDICAGGDAWTKVFRPVNVKNKWVEVVIIKRNEYYKVLRVTEIARQSLLHAQQLQAGPQRQNRDDLQVVTTGSEGTLPATATGARREGSTSLTTSTPQVGTSSGSRLG